VADREARRLSFGSVAADYDRYRPSPPPQALDWLIPPGATAILDLAAGTGAVTREIMARNPRPARVVAVEPDARMRAVLAARCPGAEVLDGQGEAIPLPDASVDAVLISAAWHWLDPGRAVPEITRVLRVGGTLGVIWTYRDDRVPWVAEFDALARESREADRARLVSEAAVDETDHPVEAFVRIRAPLEALGRLKHREPVHGAADGSDGVVHLSLGDAVPAQHGRDRVDDAGARGQQWVLGPGELGADRGRVPARVRSDVGPGCGQRRR